MPRVALTDAVLGREDTGVAILLDGASVQVNIAGGGAATVYAAASGGTTVTNPLTSDNGRLAGYVTEGSYELVATYDDVEADPVPFEARAAYPSGASDGQVLTWSTTSSAVAWSDPSAVSAGLPWTVQILPQGLAATQTNWNTLSGVTDATYFIGAKFSSGAQNAEIGWDVVLAAGTWTLQLLHYKGPAEGIYTVTLDGDAVDTVDAYAVSGAPNNASSITGITVDETGKKRLLLKMATKNASSSSYEGGLQLLTFLRTA